jgi:hypothetical protein
MTRARSTGFVAAVVAAAWVTAPTLSLAAPIEYAFSSDASVEGETVTGTFTFDAAAVPAAAAESSIDISISGSILTATFTLPTTNTSPGILDVVDGSGDELRIAFDNPLDTSPDPLSWVIISTPVFSEGSTGVTGSADSPPSLSLPLFSSSAPPSPAST